jgi:hypothetical protein
MSTQILEVYRVNLESSKPVILEVSIGNGQLGITSANLEERKIINEVDGNFQHEIGPGPEIDGKSLFVTTMVKDVQTASNKTSVTYKLINGISQYTGTMKKEVSAEGGAVFYTAYFLFNS